MNRRFIRDGWHFDVTVRHYDGGDERQIKVKFYDADLHSPTLEDLFKVSSTETSEEEVSEKKKLLGVIPYTTTKTVEKPLMDLEEHLDYTMDMAWDKIDSIEASPSEQLDAAIEEVKY